MHLGEIFFCLAKRSFAPPDAPSCETPAAAPRFSPPPSIGGPVLHFAACFLAFITIQEVFANETLFSSFGSFRSSAARAARSATCFCSSPHQGPPRALPRLVPPFRQRRRDSRSARTGSEISGI